MIDASRVTTCLYPWDVLGDAGLPARVHSLGIERVVLAAAYHSTRAATPQHPRHRVVDAHHSALYLPVRPDVWADRALVPAPATEWTGEVDSFGLARAALVSAGIEVDAWVVLTHNSLLGGAHPELTLHNAFGDRYRYALCPANEQVRQYARLLVQEVVALGQPSGLVVEACGPMGFAHLSHHDKTAGASWSSVDDQLLSLCFCAACTTQLTAAEVDVENLAATVRDAVGSGADSLATVLAELYEPVLAVRSATIAALRDEVIVVARAAGVQRLTFHASADPWATGPAAAVAGAQGAADGYIAGCWGPVDANVEALRALRAAAGAGPRIGAYVTVLPPYAPDSVAFARQWAALLEGGADELHVYHAGLASADRLAAATAALRTLTR